MGAADLYPREHRGRMEPCPQCRKRPRDETCGLLVFTSGNCPVCLETVNPVVALPCGHTLCQADYERLGVRLPNAEASDPARAEQIATDEALARRLQEQEAAPTASPQRADHQNRQVCQRTESDPSIWVHCVTEGGGWKLWHTSLHDEHERFEYPIGTKFAVDGRGGVWALCSIRGHDQWRLWHADQHGEADLYEYPSNSQLVGDGCGGVWVLCRTSGQWRLWHANNERERQRYVYPADSELISDGRGGVWVHCRTGEHEEDSKWELWHADLNHERARFEYPCDTKFAGDGRGGVWALCRTDGTDGMWRSLCGTARRAFVMLIF